MSNIISLNEKLTKHGVFKGREYTAVWFAGSEQHGEPGRWDNILDYADEDWDDELYQHLNQELFEETA